MPCWYDKGMVRYVPYWGIGWYNKPWLNLLPSYSSLTYVSTPLKAYSSSFVSTSKPLELAQWSTFFLQLHVRSTEGHMTYIISPLPSHPLDTIIFSSLLLVVMGPHDIIFQILNSLVHVYFWSKGFKKIQKQDKHYICFWIKDFVKEFSACKQSIGHYYLSPAGWSLKKIYI